MLGQRRGQLQDLEERTIARKEGCLPHRSLDPDGGAQSLYRERTRGIHAPTSLSSCPLISARASHWLSKQKPDHKRNLLTWSINVHQQSRVDSGSGHVSLHVLLPGSQLMSHPCLHRSAWRRLGSDSGGDNEGDPEQCHLLLSSENK